MYFTRQGQPEVAAVDTDTHLAGQVAGRVVVALEPGAPDRLAARQVLAAGQPQQALELGWRVVSARLTAGSRF